ncbi:MAG TPA: hypothetical protein VFB61_15730 [Gemmatimonadales bacterium]|nr:hypothetical protein [Gemmatimonadales bacterium]
MRIMALVFSFTVTLSLTALALTYVPAYVGQSRIYVQGSEDSTSVHQAYHSYGSSDSASRDSAPASPEPDPYHQRYYSATEGWTYYTLPAPVDSFPDLSSLPESRQ